MKQNQRRFELPFAGRVAFLLLALVTAAQSQQPQPLPIPNACAQQPDGAPPCRDGDGDGFCDSWELAQRIPDGALLPDADPNKPDIYVYYDWMDYGLSHLTCTTDQNCTSSGVGHRGEKCGGIGSQYEGRCTYACTADSDCTSRWPTEVHRGEKCIRNACRHTHDPMVVDPGELDAVAGRFAAHGIHLHIIRGRAVPHSNVVSWRRDERMQVSCEGGSLSAGTVGVGKYAVSLYDLKPAEAAPDAYHYTLFGHYSGCDSIAHCSACPDQFVFGQSGVAEESGNDLVVSLGGLVNDTGLSPHFRVAGTFLHELGHNLGLRHDGHLDRACSTSQDCSTGDTCTDLWDGQGLACHETVGGVLGAEESNYKPNYLSIMNYAYEGNGIEVGNALGSRVALECDTDSECGGEGGMCVTPRGARTPGNHCSVSARSCTTNADCPVEGESCLTPEPRPRTCSKSAYVCATDLDCNQGESCLAPTKRGTCARLDYSRRTLPTGGATPGALDEANLDDTVGLGSGTTDIFRHMDGRCSTTHKPAGSTGPVNWAGTGVYTTPSGDLYQYEPESFTDTGVQADIDAEDAFQCINNPDPRDVLHGHTDWPDLSGVPFNYKFQCTAPAVTGHPRRHERGIAIAPPKPADK